MDKLRVTKAGYVVEVHRVCLQLTNGQEICGLVNIAEKNCQRLSELFTRDQTDFIVLSKCDNGQKVMFINKAHIVWARPVGL